MLLTEAAARYVNEAGTARTRATRKSKLTELRRLAATHPALQLHQFTTEHLARHCLAGNPAPNTVKRRRSLMVNFFDWCVWAKLLKASPATSLKYVVRTSGQGVRHNHWLTESDVAAVLRSLPDDFLGRRARTVLMIGFMMGLRVNEIANLRWSHFSADLGRLNLRGKGGKVATLGVPPQVRETLERWRPETSGDVLFPSVKFSWTTDEMVVQWDAPLQLGGVSNLVRQASRTSGIPFRPHDMRRTFAGILEAKGVPVANISRLMRHSNVATTSVYLETNPQRVAEMADTFELAL